MPSDPLKPQFFVTRQNGRIVPLIAMDELPSTFKIRNVSRSLSPYDVSGMTGIGTFDARHLQHVVEPSLAGHLIDRSIMGTAITSQVDRALMASKYAATGFEHHPSPSHHFTNSYPTPPKAYGIDEQAPSILIPPPITPIREPQAPPPTPTLPPTTTVPTTSSTRIDHNAHHPLPPWHDISSLPLQAAPGIKEYCSYWLRHGECDYAQQGCLYKHEMPLDKLTLERLGLRDIPRWYRTKHGLGSYLAASVDVGGSTGGERMERKEKEEMMMGRTWRRGERQQSSTAMGAGREFEKLKIDVGGGSGDVNSKATNGTMSRRRPSLSSAGININAKSGSPRSRQQTKLHTAKAIHMKVPDQKPKLETEKERQMRKTLAELDRYEEQERLKKALLASQITNGDDDVAAAAAAATRALSVKTDNSSEVSTPTSATFEKAHMMSIGGVNTPTMSVDSSDYEEVKVGIERRGEAQAQTQAQAQARMKGSANADAANCKISPAAQQQGRGRKRDAKKVHSDRPVAPPSESRESMWPEKVQKDLLERYGHGD